MSDYIAIDLQNNKKKWTFRFLIIRGWLINAVHSQMIYFLYAGSSNQFFHSIKRKKKITTVIFSVVTSENSDDILVIQFHHDLHFFFKFRFELPKVRPKELDGDRQYFVCFTILISSLVHLSVVTLSSSQNNNSSLYVFEKLVWISEEKD